MKPKKQKCFSERKPTRKQLRKKERQQKKVRRNEYNCRRGKQNGIPGQFVKNRSQKEMEVDDDINETNKTTNVHKNEKVALGVQDYRNKEKQIQRKLQNDMDLQRNKQLLLANEVEDRNIKKLEKQLKLTKRKSKGIPKSFTEDGLDYLLEVCDEDLAKAAVTAEQQFTDFNEDFMEDLTLMSKNMPSSNSDNAKVNENSSDDEQFHSDFDMDEEDDASNHTDSRDDSFDLKSSDDDVAEKECYRNMEIETIKDNSTEMQVINPNKKIKIHITKKKGAGHKETINDDYEEDYSDEDGSVEDNPKIKSSKLEIKGATKVNSDGTWEDIYGRLRFKDGSIVTGSNNKYIPPAVRAKMENDNSAEKKLLERLRKQLKGLINRLAESNMHSIAGQIEDLYMKNSRNDMNESLTKLILESVLTKVLTPERLLMEHILLIAILHANVGTEVGANFLQTVVKHFDLKINKNTCVEDKTLDNIVIVLAQLYNFKLFDSKIIYQILNKLAETFNEKNIDCILHILKNVGFNLRRDDPLALKDLILELQKKAATISEHAVSGTRIKFLLDILLAIKNNNMSKIPNYDNTYSEHLKKIMKSFIRKGNYVTQLNITLEDLLKADEKGKWWIVGSAWTGNLGENENKLDKPKVDSFSNKLLQLSKKQRMNTDTRRNVFCIIMSAEDYLDAFEKLLHLGLKNNQEREIIHVILHCCLQENPYNPYYAFLAQKFCDYDRKYQLTIKYSVWDKLKTINEQSAKQLSNLSRLLIHLFMEKGLPISTLKIVQFGELDKVTLRFMRQILLGILLHEDLEACTQVFEKVAQSDKLKMFRESLRLFIHHFLLKNIQSENMDEKQKNVLETRAKIIEKLLIIKEKNRF